MGSSNSKEQLKDELPRDINRFLDNTDEIRREKALRRFRSVMLKGSDLSDHEDYKKVIQIAKFRKIVLRGFDENTSDEKRQEILDTFMENPAPKWSFTDIIAHPSQYRRRPDRILKLQYYTTLSKDTALLRKITKLNGIRQLILQNCNVRAEDLTQLLDGAINVTILDLSQNQMGIAEARVIKTFVHKKCPSELLMQGCGLTGEATYLAIEEYKGSSKEISVLDLSGNELEEEAIDIIGSLINNKKLAKLAVKNCPASDGGFREMLKRWELPKFLPSRMQKAFIKVRDTAIFMCEGEYSKLHRAQTTHSRQGSVVNGAEACETSAQSGQEHPIARVASNSSTHDQTQENALPSAASNVSSQHQSQPDVKQNRQYDLSVFRGKNDVWVVIDKEKKANRHYELPKTVILRRLPIFLCEKVSHRVEISCEESPDIVRTGPKEFNEKQLGRLDVSIHRFVLGEAKPQTLEMKVTIHHGLQPLVEEIIFVTWPSNSDERDRARDVYHINANNCEVKGGAQAAMAAGCDNVKFDVDGGVQNKAAEPDKQPLHHDISDRALSSHEDN